MKQSVVVLTSAAVLLVSGCMVGPKYARPSAPSSSSFKETAQWQPADGWKVAEPQDVVPRDKWWQLYGDSKLNELEEQVDSSNQTLKIAEANFSQARAAIRFSRSALAPTVAVAPSLSSVRDSANEPYIPSDLETVRLSLHAEVAIDYFEVRSADAQKRLLDDTVKAYSEALELTKNRFEGGVAPKADVAEAETQLNTTRVQASEIMVQRAQYEHALAILVGKTPAGFSLPATPLNIQSPALPVVPVGLPAQ